MGNFFKKTIIFSLTFSLLLLSSSLTHSFTSTDWHDYQEKFVGDLSEKNIQADSLHEYEDILNEHLSEENIAQKALSQEDLFQLEIETLNLENFDDNMLRCLCRAACDDAGWRCGVVTCMYSPKAELSVTRLLIELTGGIDERDRLGQVMQATESFTQVTGRGPKTELELLQGLLHSKDKDSEEFQNVLKIIQSDEFRRKYDVESLILKK